MSGIRISPKHGVNPSILICPICGEDQGIALLGQIGQEDREAPRQMLDRGPCAECQEKLEEYKKQGFVLLVVDDEYENAVDKAERSFKKDYPSPWQFFIELHVIKKEAAKDMFKNFDMSKGVAFIPKSIARQIGLKAPTKG